MAMQSGSASDLVRLSYIKQTVKGTTPAGNMTVMRYSSESLTGDPVIKENDEITGDGLPVGQSIMGLNIQGDISGNLAPSVSHQDFILAAMRKASWAASITTGALVLTINSTTKAITRAAGSFVTDGFKVGDMVQLSNFVNTVNNTCVVLSAVSALSVTYIGDPSITNETGPATTTMVRPSYAEWGTVDTWFTVCKEFMDLTNKSITYTDHRVASMNIDFKFGDFAKFKFTMAGCGYALPATPLTNGRTVDPVGSESSLNASSDLGLIVINGALTDYCIEDLSISIDNKIQAANSLNNLAPQDQKATGLKGDVTLGVYLTDSNFAFHSQKLTQTPISINYFCKNSSGGYAVQIPQMQFTHPDANASGKGNMEKLSLKGMIKKDATMGNAIRIYKLT